MINYMLSVKAVMSQDFPKPYEHSSGNVKVGLYLSKFATKANLKVNRCGCIKFSIKIRFSTGRRYRCR